MRKIALTALGAAMIALTVAGPAGAAERHHTRRTAQHATVNTAAEARDSFAQFGPVYRGNDARVWGGAMSAPAGH